MCDELVKINSHAEPLPMFFDAGNCRMSGSDSGHFKWGAAKGSNEGKIKYLKDKKYGVSNNDISSLTVPPHYSVAIYEGANYTGTGIWVNPQDAICGRKGSCKQVSGSSYKGVDNNAISSLKVKRVKTWDQHKLDCCMQKPGDARVNKTLCGIFWGGSHDGSCDAVMQKHCGDSKNAGKDECSCYSRTAPKDATEAERLSLEKPTCHSATCLAKGFMPSNAKGKTCPNVTICRSELGTKGDTNTLRNVTIQQQCNTQTEETNTAPPTAVPDDPVGATTAPVDALPGAVTTPEKSPVTGASSTFQTGGSSGGSSRSTESSIYSTSSSSSSSDGEMSTNELIAIGLLMVFVAGIFLVMMFRKKSQQSQQYGPPPPQQYGPPPPQRYGPPPPPPQMQQFGQPPPPGFAY